MTVKTVARIPEDVYAKIRVMSALKQTSVNSVIVEALAEKIDRWEEKHGVLPLPPGEE